MSLRIIYGRAGSGKSYFCLEDIKNKLNQKSDTPLILIVPEQFSLQAERSLVKTMGASGFNKAEVLSFKRLAYRIFSEVGGSCRKRISQPGKCMLIFHILDKLKPDLNVFGMTAGRRGFSSTLCSIISEFKRYSVTPQILNQASKSIKGNQQLIDKLEDIGRVYEQYENELGVRYADSDDDLTVLCRKLDDSSYINGAEIWIDGFSGFTPQEYAVIEKLLTKAVNVNITLCTDCIEDEYNLSGVELFAPSRATAAKLIKIARQKGVGILKPVALNNKHSRYISDELKHLEQNVFSFCPSTYKEKLKDINVYRATSLYNEIEETARDIVRQCRENGFRYNDIAVVSGNLARYKKIISAVFTQYEIPFFIDNKRDVMGHPLIMLVLSILRIYPSNWSYEAVFRYLKTGLTGIERNDVDLIENYVLAHGIKGSKWTAEQEWRYGIYSSFKDNSTDYELMISEKVNEIRQAVVMPLSIFHEKTKGRKKVEETCSALFDMLCDIGIPERIEALVQRYKDSGQLEQANEYSQIWNMIIDILDQMVEAVGKETMTIDKFSELLEIGLTESKMGLIPPALEQLTVGSTDRSKSHNVKAMYIVGVNDGVFPTVEKDEGLLTDMERDELKELGIELAPDTRSKTFEQQYIAYSVLCASSQYIRISYPVSDGEGKTLRPSNIISRLRRVFPCLSIQSEISRENTEKDLAKICTPSPTFNEMISVMRAGTEGREINPIWKNIYDWYISKEEWKEKCRQALYAFKHTNQVKEINREKTRRLYGSNIHTSVSRLEKYASCPFSYYVEYGLKAQERKIFKLSAPDMGSFLHQVLDRFSKYIYDNGLSWRGLEKAWCIDKINQIVDELLEELKETVFTGSRRYKYLTERLKRVLIRAVWVIAEQIKRGGFEPVGYEVGFGANEQLPPITIELPTGESIILNGRIDRVDALKTEEGTYLRIIDYKSGNKSFKLSNVYYGLQIQLVTYLDAIWQGGLPDNKDNITPAGMFYFKIDDPIIKGNNTVTDEYIEKSIMKQLKMRGLLLSDVKIIREMDRQISGDSDIIPARINKDESLGRSTSATLEQFESLRAHVKRLLGKIGQEMLKGNISISPYKNKKATPCVYCSYQAICQFDSSMKNNKYRILTDKKDHEVWEMVGGIADEQSKLD